MSRLQGVLARLRSVFGARAAEARMEEEFRFHVDMEAERLERAHGLPPAEARRRALLAFGGLDAQREALRDGRGARWFADLTADARYALRAMRRAPTLAVAVALTLGVGIGVNGVVFSFVDALLFRPLPAREPRQLVGLYNLDATSKATFDLGYADYVDFRDRSGVFDGLAAFSGVPLNVVAPGAGVADMVWGEMVTENFFTVLGMRPAAGRFFQADDAPQGANPFAVISYDAWRGRFGGDPSIVGKSLRLNGTAFTVVAVAPRGFKGIRTLGFWPEIWVPVGMHDAVRTGSANLFNSRGGGPMTVIGRLHPGVDRARTATAAAGFARQLELAYPATNVNIGTLLVPGAGGFDNPSFVKPAVLALGAALGIVAALATLAIICANLANLQLARAAARVHEIAIRLSLGCSRARLVRQLVVESALLALPGVVLAGVAIRLSPVIERALVPRLQFAVGFEPSVNPRVLLFTGAVAVCAVVLFCVLPALRTSRARSLAQLIGAPRTSAGRPQRLRGLLVVSQLALSVVLLVGASLFVRSLALARAADVGFDPRDRALLSMNIGLQHYDATRGRRFYDAVVARVRTLPLVASATWGFPAPFDTYNRSQPIFVAGASSGPNAGVVSPATSWVGDDVVRALGLRLEAGRDFTTSDSVGAPAVMVVSRKLAARLWPGKDPIGQRARRNGPNGPEITVVGVVGDAEFVSSGAASQPRLYLPLRQNYRDPQTLIVHVNGDAARILPRLREVIHAADPALPVYGAITMEASLANGLAPSRSTAITAAFFGGLALLISAVGLYAVVSSGVTERTREIGVRMALGATPLEVVRLVMRAGARLGVIGVAIGIVGAAFVARIMASLLYGLSPADPVTFLVVPALLAVVVMLATLIPAWRAVKLDPIAALRQE